MFNGYANEAIIMFLLFLDLYEGGTLKKGELKLKDNILARVEWKDFRCYKVGYNKGPYQISMSEVL